jgi:hypothetical protein
VGKELSQRGIDEARDVPFDDVARAFKVQGKCKHGFDAPMFIVGQTFRVKVGG